MSARSIAFGAWFVAEARLRNMLAYLRTIALTSFFNPLMYILALGVGIGSYIDKRARAASGVAGVSYITFVGPALLASAALTAAFEETSFPVMGGFKWTREFWAMNATPISARQIANGVLLAALFRVVFTVLIFWLFLAAFGAMPGPLSALSMPASVLAGLAFGSVIMAVASRLEEDDGWFAAINRLIIAPMFLFSGTFFPLENLPLGLRWIGWISPLWHGTQLGRIAAFGLSEPAWLVAAHVLFLAGLLAAGVGLSWSAFARRLAK